MTLPYQASLHHAHLVTHDMEVTCQFYTEHFGAEIVFDAPIDGDRNVFMSIGTGRIHFFESRQPPANGKNAFHHLGLMVQDLPACVRHLQSKGVEVTPITDVPDGRFAMATAPDNLRLELFEVTDPAARRFFVAP